MIRIEGDKAALYQWDLNKRIILSDIAFIKADIEVHYSCSDVFNSEAECLIAPSYIENGNVYADIPNKFLQNAGFISTYLYVQNGDEAGTEYKTEILVLPRNKPANYVYTETEVKRYEDFESRIKALEEEEVDFTGYATEEFVKKAVEDAEVDLTGYATEKFVNDTISDSTPDWNQNDSAAPDYIKNRPFYGEPAKVLFDGEVRMEYGMDDGYFEFNPMLGLVEGETYTLIRDNGAETLTGVCVKTAYYRSINFGNGFGGYNVMLLDGIDNETRFIISYPNIMSFHLKIVQGGGVELKKLDTKYLPSEVLEPADWNQNDATAPNYIKNRPFYSEESWSLVHEAEATFNNYNGQYNVVIDTGYPHICGLEMYAVGTICKVVIDGEEYIGALKADGGNGYFGNGYLWDAGRFADTGESFCVSAGGLDCINVITTKPVTTCKVSVFVYEGETVYKLDAKYLPDKVVDRKPLVLDANLSDYYGGHVEAGDEALEAIKTGRQILVRVPNASGDNYVASYSPVYFKQLPLNGQYLYLFYLRDEKQDFSALLGQPAGTVMMPMYGQLKMLLSKKYNSNPLEQ